MTFLRVCSWRRVRLLLPIWAVTVLVTAAGCQGSPISLPLLATGGPLPTTTPSPTISSTPIPSPSPTGTPEPVAISVAPQVLSAYGEAVARAIAEVSALEIDDVTRSVRFAPEGEPSSVDLALESLSEALAARVFSDERSVYFLAERFYALVAPFQTVRDDVPLGELQARWIGESEGALFVSAEAASELQASLGLFGAQIVAPEEMLSRLAAQPGSLGILPFDQLDPRYKAMTVGGVNVLSNDLDPSDYPLALALLLRGAEAPAVGEALAPYFQELNNRDPAKLTTLIMTGVTAMSRMTAKRMEEHGTLYPALIISDVLRAADITHVNNEVPFIKGCKVNLTPKNLIFCSDYDYWDALEAIGTDIVGLSGNHVNDLGLDGARESLAFYRHHKIAIYGGGDDLDQACAPLILEDHGNKLAFMATIAWGPEEAWATESTPGNCPFYQQRGRIERRLSGLKVQVDVVLLEVQYLETYNPYPTGQQVDEFREVRKAGADVVTGVQSHVPQAWEPYGGSDAGGPGIIIYGLGNLFFDQMWSWETRTGLIARHTIYDGRLLSSEILTTVLEDYAQPRWATPEERAEILRRIFDAAPERPATEEESQPAFSPTATVEATPQP